MRPVVNNKQDGIIEHNSWPTSNDWERYKPTIINLYKSSQMRFLITEMKDRHNFKATKRMYETRLWKWGVVKNMKKADKVKVIKSIQKSSASVADISAGDWSKVVRCHKTEMKECEAILRENMASFSSTEQPQGTTQAMTAFSENNPLETRLQLHVLAGVNLQSQASISITQSVRQCCSEQLKNSSELDVFEPLATSISGHPRRYWETVKHAIYILKSQSTSLCGIRLWESADEMVLHGISYESFDFVWELFAVLSPANTTACPELRQASLRYLRALTATKLHPTHPVTKICGLLLHNAYDIELSEIALLEAWNIFGSRLGYEHQTACRLQRMLVSTARRLGNLTEAERRARALYNHACTSRMDSYLSRSCARSLSHVLISSYQYHEAREVCKSIVDSLQSPAGSAIGDERAVQAMEDLADIELRLGNIGQSLWYLQRANDAGRKLWPGSVASAQMEEKLGWDIYAPKIPVVC